MAKFQYGQFMLFGDSITEYSSVEEHGLTPALQKGTGYNTRQALQALPHIIPSPEQAKLRLLTIGFGANDATSPEANNDFHVPLAQYKENLQSILSHPSIAAQSCRVLLITPPPIDEYQHETKDRMAGQPGLTRFSQSAKDYADACRQVGETMHVPVFDLWGCLMRRAGWSDGGELAGAKDAPRSDVLGQLLSDGVHFTSQGYQVFYENLMDFVSRTYPDLKPENMPFVFPTCDEFTGELEK
ncbi:hypothetical protein TruAng_009181 [Truncatella angustata]|nr:hypothetical protein TruAng_009181 [Truncatella angustata]